MKRLLLGTAAALLTSAALAADLPQRPASYSAAPVFSWTGFYLGLNGGYGWARSSSSLSVLGIPIGTLSSEANGGFGGVQAGYNWQTGVLVFGVEGDFQVSGIKGRTSGTVLGLATTTDLKTPWFATVRGRIGVTPSERWMVYATGGLLEVKSKMTVTIAGVANSDSDTSWGGVVGAGTEVAFSDHWSAKVEYLHLMPKDNTTTIGLVSTTTKSSGDLVRVGANYRF